MPDTPAPHEPEPPPTPQKQTEKKDEPRPAAGTPAQAGERKPLDLRVRTVRHDHDASGGH